MAAFLAKISLLAAMIPVIQAISCLVVRPGYGLVSEQCPSSAVGCRIRVMKDRIDWYEWAKLYDRNQLVCVYPEEYGSESGCQKKASGSVRCWCGGSDDCNDAENSKGLYEKHIGPLNHKKTELLSNRIVTTTRAATTTAASTTTISTRRVTTKHPRIHIHTSKRTPATTRSTTTTTEATITTTRPTPRTTTMAATVFHEVNARPLPTDDRDKYDEMFDATRKALERQMKEEDERLQQMLLDEEDEEAMDEEEEQKEMEKQEEKQPQTTETTTSLPTTTTTPSTEEKNRHERRERAREEERRRQEEEERLARIEREEIEEMERREREQTERLEDEDYEYEGGFGLTGSSSSLGPFFSLLTFVLTHLVLW